MKLPYLDVVNPMVLSAKYADFYTKTIYFHREDTRVLSRRWQGFVPTLVYRHRVGGIFSLSKHFLEKVQKIILLGNQLLNFLKPSQLDYTHFGMFLRKNTLFFALNQSMLKYGNFINMLMRKIIFYIVFMTPFIRHETLFYSENIYFLFESYYDFLSNL